MLGAWRGEEPGCRGALNDEASKQKDDVARESTRLTHIVCRHLDLDAAASRGTDDALHGLGRSRIEAGGRFVQKEHRPVAGKRAGECTVKIIASALELFTSIPPDGGGLVFLSIEDQTGNGTREGVRTCDRVCQLFAHQFIPHGARTSRARPQTGALTASDARL